MHEGERILIVEDDPDLRHLFRTALRLDGFVVSEAGDVLGALHAIENETPDLIVLDIGLPRISGIAVQEELAAHAETRSIPILVVTGSALPLAHLPPDCVVRKPVTPERLVAEVRACLRRSRADADASEVLRESHAPRGSTRTPRSNGQAGTNAGRKRN